MTNTLIKIAYPWENSTILKTLMPSPLSVHPTWKSNSSFKAFDKNFSLIFKILIWTFKIVHVFFIKKKTHISCLQFENTYLPTFSNCKFLKSQS